MNPFSCLDGGMVDTRDLKSLGGNPVWVRVPLRAIFCRAKNRSEAMHLKCIACGTRILSDVLLLAKPERIAAPAASAKRCARGSQAWQSARLWERGAGERAKPCPRMNIVFTLSASRVGLESSPMFFVSKNRRGSPARQLRASGGFA